MSDNDKYDLVQEFSDRTHANLAEQMTELFRTVVAKDITTMEQFNALEVERGDIVICYNKESEIAEGKSKFNTAWILLGSHGKCMLLGDLQTEDIDWFMKFSPVTIIRH